MRFDAPFLPVIYLVGFHRRPLRSANAFVLAPDRPFWFDVYLFDRNPMVAFVVAACLGELCHRGFGPSRARAILEGVELLSPGRGVARCLPPLTDWMKIPEPWLLPWQPATSAASRIRVRFVTPTELRVDGQVLRSAPSFPVLIARTRDRLSALSLLYGEPVAAFDYRGIVERAAAVQLIDARIEQTHGHRHSTRTERDHPLQGFLGSVTYEGPVSETLELLRAAWWTGIGRQTVWGHGALLVDQP